MIGQDGPFGGHPVSRLLQRLHVELILVLHVDEPDCRTRRCFSDTISATIIDLLRLYLSRGLREGAEALRPGPADAHAGPVRREFECVRDGTQTLIAAFNVATVQVSASLATPAPRRHGNHPLVVDMLTRTPARRAKSCSISTPPLISCTATKRPDSSMAITSVLQGSRWARIVPHIRTRWPNAKVVLRAYSGFAREALIPDLRRPSRTAHRSA
jgi:hypothetical protein